MWKSTFSIVFTCLALTAMGQQSNQELKIGQPKPDWRPSMIRVSYDIIPVGEAIFTSTRSGQHFQASVDFHKYFFMVEYGTQQTQRGERFSYQYENNGSYFRLGPEVNLLKNSVINTLNFGIRYARSTFDDQVSFTKTLDNGTVNPTEIPVNESNNGVVAQWAELTAGLNVNVWKGMYMGYTIRYKFRRKITGNDVLTPYDIPGFGLHENRLGVGFNYFIGWAFKWREKEPLTPVLIK